MSKKGIIGIVILALVGFGIWFFLGQNKEMSKDKGAVKIGVIAPLSGDNAFYGELLKNNFDIVFANETKYELVYEDSKFEAKTSISAFQKLSKVDKVQIVLGEVASGNSIAVAPVAQKNKVILFSSISSADQLKDAGHYFFRNIPRNDVQGKTVAEFIYNDLKINNVALFGLNDEYGVNISKSFTSTFEALGGKIAIKETHEKGQKDFRVTLNKIKASGAQAIFAPGDKNEPAIILKQSKELGLSIPILSGDGASNDDVIRIAGNASEGFYTSNVMINKNSEFYKNYRELFFTKFNKEPSAYDAYAYEAAKIVLEAVKSAGDDSKLIMEYLYNTEFESMTGKLKFDKDGEVDRLWGIYEVINGKFTEIK